MKLTSTSAIAGSLELVVVSTGYHLCLHHPTLVRDDVEGAAVAAGARVKTSALDMSSSCVDLAWAS
jgi:hypothetical protein